MYIPFESTQQFMSALEALPRRPTEHLAIFLANAHEPELDALLGALSEADLPFFGGIFPALIDADHVRDTGAIVRAVPLRSEPLVAAISDECVAWQTSLPDADAFANHATTAFIISDYWSPNVSTLLAELFEVFGGSVQYLGMGAGTLKRQTSRCVFTTQGRFQASALVAFMALQSDSHLRHGWRRVAGPLVATRTRRNIIDELDWEPALDTYMSLVRADFGDFEASDFTQIARQYPFGIYREEHEDVVRDPFGLTEGEALVCLSDIPQNSLLYILKGDAQLLIDGAGQVAGDVAASSAGNRDSVSACLVMDCYSRAVFLDERFAEELKILSERIHDTLPRVRLEGVLALGEIASDGGHVPDMHNKTCLVSVLHEP